MSGQRPASPVEAASAPVELVPGVRHDLLGDRGEALASFDGAARLDPGDARPDVDAAELWLESGDEARARKLLGSGLRKARARHDSALARKCESLIHHLDK